MNQTTDYEYWRIQTLIAFPYTQLEFDMIDTVKNKFPAFSLDYHSTGYNVEYFETKDQFYQWIKNKPGILPLFAKRSRKYPQISFYYYDRIKSEQD